MSAKPKRARFKTTKEENNRILLSIGNHTPKPGMKNEAIPNPVKLKAESQLSGVNASCSTNANLPNDSVCYKNKASQSKVPFTPRRSARLVVSTTISKHIQVKCGGDTTPNRLQSCLPKSNKRVGASLERTAEKKRKCIPKVRGKTNSLQITTITSSSVSDCLTETPQSRKRAGQPLQTTVPFPVKLRKSTFLSEQLKSVNPNSHDMLDRETSSEVLRDTVTIPETDLKIGTENKFEVVWLNEHHDDSGELQEETKTSRTRNRIANKAAWPREISKNKRQHGEAYIGYRKNEENIVVHDMLRPERKIGPPCTSTYCLKAAKRNCSSIIEEMRENLFHKFWNDMDWDQKKVYIVSLIDICPTKRKYVENSRRSVSLKYFSRTNNGRIQVCQSMFLSTFGLNESMVYYWVEESDNGIVPSKSILNHRRALSRPFSELKIFNAQRKDFLADFFRKLPKMESHYCRKQTKKEYLQPDFHSLAELYDFYNLCCKAVDAKPLSKCSFSNIFHSSNLGLYQPKKDRCDLCIRYEAGTLKKEDYDDHIRQKTRAQTEKTNDKARAKRGEVRVLSKDVQAVKMVPVNNCSSMFFKMKLKMHNFTIFDLASCDCMNYWWHEGEADLESSMFATCVIKHLHKYCNDDLPVILWSDGCTYQNRNQILSNALLDYAVREVTQKFLVKGHTQMEVDHVHALIERKLHKREINLPSDYIDITKKARRSKPLEAELLSHEDFKCYDDPNLYRYKGIRPGTHAGDPTVYDLRVIHYTPDGKIKYKVDFDEELRDLPGSTKIPTYSYSEIKPYYSECPKITQRKFDDLQDLKQMLPQEVHYFYDNLNH